MHFCRCCVRVHPQIGSPRSLCRTIQMVTERRIRTRLQSAVRAACVASSKAPLSCVTRRIPNLQARPAAPPEPIRRPSLAYGNLSCRHMPQAVRVPPAYTLQGFRVANRSPSGRVQHWRVSMRGGLSTQTPKMSPTKKKRAPRMWKDTPDTDVSLYITQGTRGCNDHKR